ncbi:TetR/AcrR family transcriptional regulator [Roseobacter sp. CCS2]|uniref:TetR/AcrR family transcriptional regulator n=1 Tax=Roseobacter sp. CCS2 TaxID=391593 RepID=UPI0000F40441|nr:TetR/AcrR family transcriptional regulator [Roseobacter sp. CCS2]EBA13948.1 putative transcriptional regulatory protein [Roseobacter sp. CCS2]
MTDVLWKTGFLGTSISDLSRASGTSRASLYKLYGDKFTLLAAALDCYAARFDARVDKTLQDTTDPANAVEVTLRASADRLSDPSAPNGCLRCRTTLELKGQSPVVDAAIERANQAFEANMLRLLAADGRTRATDGPMSRKLTAIVNGMVILAEGGASRESLHELVSSAVADVRSKL